MMKYKEWRFYDRSGWRSGPWDAEPDKVQWPDELTGLPCLALRSASGYWCGYVGVPAGHCYFDAGYDEVPLMVHGGPTLSGWCDPGEGVRRICHDVESEEPEVYWLGFDCAHVGDYIPYFGFAFGEGGEYRDLDYVRKECASLARQILEAGRQ
jgi:hypothetical protein